MTDTPSITRGLRWEQLPDLWQFRVLKLARGKVAAAFLSVLAHSWPDDVPVLCRAVFPGYRGISTPFFASAGKIREHGHVCADMIDRQNRRIRNYVVFDSEADLEGAFRTLADKLKLTDADRLDLFAALKRWIVADFRVNPVTGEKDKAA